jgi:hypothetical protein
MSRAAEIVWLTQEPGSDPMGEFGAEARSLTGPVETLGAVKRYAGALLQAVPVALPSAQPPDPAPPSVQAAAPPASSPAPVVPESSAAAPALQAPALPVRVHQGRWFVWLAVLALLALVQAPFVVLWALQAVNGPAPIAIEVAKPAVAFAVAPLVPVERTLVVRPPRPAAPAPRPVPPGSLSGFLRVDVAVPMRISEDGRLLGTTDVDRLMLPAGDHTLDLRNDELQFTTRQTVTIKPGDTTAVQVRLPSAPLSINARPWAEAWIDGERVGDTPIGTLMRTIGRHEIVLRHPELGERRVPVVITLAQPARVSVDFRAGK